MYYSQDELSKINAHLKKIATKKAFGFGRSKQLADALYTCITTNELDKRTSAQKLSDLSQLIADNGSKHMKDTFASAPGALKLIMSRKSAEAFQRVWERCTLYPYSSGMLRKPFRTERNSMRYLGKNISLLQDMVYDSAFGEIDVSCELKKKKEPYKYSPLIAALLASEIDSGNEELLELSRDIIYGDNDNGSVSRELILGLLMSKSAQAHKMVSDLLLAAKLQEGLRQAIVESMDEGSREGFLHILNVILENDLVRFSSVARALDTSTGLLIPPKKPPL